MFPIYFSDWKWSFWKRVLRQLKGKSDFSASALYLLRNSDRAEACCMEMEIYSLGFLGIIIGASK